MSKPATAKWYHPTVLLVTWFASGLVPKGKGTAGSLAALPFAWVFYQYGGPLALWVATIAATAIGWWASARYMRMHNRQDDPQEIVIDEVAGQWLVLACVPLLYLDPTPKQEFVVFIGAFLCFRLFDIWKPWPISLADRKVKGALGVMLDDLLAMPYAVMLLGFLGHLDQIAEAIIGG
ncbi:MAG: phosphatidylglycerophosphatase A [Rickettsiales bacterium]|nr:phosphatidylglycerophosphatase A [Rickettsiales bacterium]